MPVFHFHIHDDVSGASPDREGTELPDAAAAEREAVRFAGEAIAQNAILNRCGREWHLDVTDHTGAPLFHVDFLTRATGTGGAPDDASPTIARHLRIGAR